MEQLNNTESLTAARETFDYQSRPRNNQVIDDMKGKVADGLTSVAGRLKQKGEQNGPMSDYANQASGWLDNAAEYVREFDPSQVKADIQRQVRENPGRTLLIAGAAGLVVGALFRRR